MQAIPYNIPAGYQFFVVHSNLRLTADIKAAQYATANGLASPAYLGYASTGFFLVDLLGLLLGADIAYHYQAKIN